MVDDERLLLVEDDATTREVLQLLLQAEGWRVEAVESGEAALEAMRASSEHFSVLLCDLHLTGLCGEALALDMKKLAPRALTIAMTATALSAVAPGYDVLLVKPFAPGAVEAAWSSSAFVLPETGAVADEPLLAMETMDQLKKSMGEEGMRSMYSFALADAQNRVDRMEAAVASGNQATFTHEAHALKGSFGMIGARKLWQLAANAESAALDASSPEKVSALRRAIVDLRLMLDTLLTG